VKLERVFFDHRLNGRRRNARPKVVPRYLIG
jgi:hypothetical protein